MPSTKPQDMLDAIESFWVANGGRALAIRPVVRHAQARGVTLTSQTVYTYFRGGWIAARHAAGARLADDFSDLVAELQGAGDVSELAAAWAQAALARPGFLRLAVTGRSIRGEDGEPVAGAQVRDACERLAVLAGGWAAYCALLGLTQGLAAERLTWAGYLDAAALTLGAGARG